MGSWTMATSRHLARLGLAPASARSVFAPRISGRPLWGRPSASPSCLRSSHRAFSAQPQVDNDSAPSASSDGPRIIRVPAELKGAPKEASQVQRTLQRREGLDPLDTFARRHIGPDDHEIRQMLRSLEPPVESISEFVRQVIPPSVLSDRPIYDPVPGATTRDASVMAKAGAFPHGASESEIAETGASWAAKNMVDIPCFLGAGYTRALTPEVIKRNILESPAWYTSYTPYQPEISQGRLESLLNFQTMVTDLTGLPVANASLLDEATAAAEAMTLSLNALPASRAKRPGKTFLLADTVAYRTFQVMQGRAEGFGLHVERVDVMSPEFYDRVEKLGEDLVGVMVQYPNMFGRIEDYRNITSAVHKSGALVSCATELMALTLFTPPGEWGADIAFGSSQRFGVPMGSGGPHAAFFAVADKYKRKMPGRLVGVSRDRLGGRALRLALQTREQHIRREKATSNVCTAQALPANLSAMYAVYHGPQGLKAIAQGIMNKARYLELAFEALGYDIIRPSHDSVAWDTVVVDVPQSAISKTRMSIFSGVSTKPPFHCRYDPPRDRVSFTVDEATTVDELTRIIDFFSVREDDRGATEPNGAREAVAKAVSGMQPPTLSQPHKRVSAYLQHPVFNTHQSETEMLRYIHHLQSKDLSLVHSMIPLGSCTMKLNGSVEMAMLSLPGFANLHPHVRLEGRAGYVQLVEALSYQLRRITAMDYCYMEPNSGAQGEFAGLRLIREYHKRQGRPDRDICLIPVSAHGTNPASAAMAGMRVVPIKCDAKTGNLDVEDLRAKCEEHRDKLGAIMVTYPSTYGVFEPRIKEVCDIVHEHGGQVYMDGANMNAQIGLCSPGEIGADVCHLNLHKTFCIPHGGGGPGAGPICYRSHLSLQNSGKKLYVSGAQLGNASVLPISWAYNALMGADGLKKATQVTLLSANYLLARLKPHYPILYTNEHGRCAHEFILDARPFQKTAGVEVIDIAKRLQDYGFHAPTMSFPVAGTLMIEPTESESLEELDRFAEALISIRQEIREVEEGRQPREGNVLKMAPHPLHDIISGDGEGGARWDRPYTRDRAAYPLPWLREKKFWPSVARVDDAHGDLNLFCTCPPVEDTTGGADISSVQTSETK